MHTVHPVHVAHPQPRPAPPHPTPKATHTATVVPKAIVDPTIPAPDASPETAYVFVAMIIPALIAAGATTVNHVFRRNS